MNKTYYNILESFLVIYAASQGKLKVFLKKKKMDPYKGYWILPGDILTNDETIEQSAIKIYKQATNLNTSKIFQGKIFSNLDRDPNGRIIAATSIAITDEKLVNIKHDDDTNEMQWFDVDKLPKMGYDHKEIINQVTEEVKRKIVNNYDDILLDFFPNDFTLPELQKFYETISKKTMDRRNFHKKFVSQNLVIDTGLKVNSGNGRPGRLYKFNKEKMKGKKIWIKMDGD